jgi:hypothetical protein
LLLLSAVLHAATCLHAAFVQEHVFYIVERRAGARGNNGTFG